MEEGLENLGRVWGTWRGAGEHGEGLENLGEGLENV